MNSDEFYEYENRAYVNPTLSSGEQEAFISNLRDTQNQNNAQIQEQTYNLGTRVPSNLGGLGGGEAYFNARYQTPQVDEMVTSLKTASQAQSFNDAMQNYNSQLQNRYKQAYRDYQQRQRAKARSYYSGLSGNDSNTPNNNNSSGWNGDVETISTSEGEAYPTWQDITIGDDAASYGVNYLRRNAGETDDAWYKRANEWAEKLAMSRNFLRTGKF